MNACAVASNVFNSKSYNEFVKQQKAQQQQLATGNGGNNNKRTDLCFCFDSFSELRILSALPVELCVCVFALLGRQSALAAQGLILFLVSSLCGLADKPVSIKYLSPRPLLFFIVYALRISSKHSAAVLLLSSLWRLCFILITQNIVHILN